MTFFVVIVAIIVALFFVIMATEEPELAGGCLLLFILGVVVVTGLGIAVKSDHERNKVNAAVATAQAVPTDTTVFIDPTPTPVIVEEDNPVCLKDNELFGDACVVPNFVSPKDEKRTFTCVVDTAQDGKRQMTCTEVTKQPVQPTAKPE